MKRLHWWYAWLLEELTVQCHLFSHSLTIAPQTICAYKTAGEICKVKGLIQYNIAHFHVQERWSGKDPDRQPKVIQNEVRFERAHAIGRAESVAGLWSQPGLLI